LLHPSNSVLNSTSSGFISYLFNNSNLFIAISISPSLHSHFINEDIDNKSGIKLFSFINWLNISVANSNSSLLKHESSNIFNVEVLDFTYSDQLFSSVNALSKKLFLHKAFITTFIVLIFT